MGVMSGTLDLMQRAYVGHRDPAAASCASTRGCASGSRGSRSACSSAAPTSASAVERGRAHRGRRPRRASAGRSRSASATRSASSSRASGCTFALPPPPRRPASVTPFGAGDLRRRRRARRLATRAGLARDARRADGGRLERPARRTDLAPGGFTPARLRARSSPGKPRLRRRPRRARPLRRAGRRRARRRVRRAQAGAGRGADRGAASSPPSRTRCASWSLLRERGLPAGRRVVVEERGRPARRVPLGAGATLLDCFDADTSGRDFAHGKPAPDIFLAAAEELGVAPAAVLRGRGRGGRRPGGEGGRAWRRSASRATATRALLAAAGADLVVDALDEVDVDGVLCGELRASGE